MSTLLIISGGLSHFEHVHYEIFHRWACLFSDLLYLFVIFFFHKKKIIKSAGRMVTREGLAEMSTTLTNLTYLEIAYVLSL